MIVKSHVLDVIWLNIVVGVQSGKSGTKKYAEIRNAGLEKAYEKIKKYQKLKERKNELEQKLKQTEEKNER